MKYKVVMQDGEALEFDNVVFCNSADDIVYLKDSNSTLFLAATTNVKYMVKIVQS